MSSFSKETKRISDVLKSGGSSQVSDYKRRFSSLENLYEDLLSNLIKKEFDCKEAYATAREFFGDSTVRFAGIDGTMYSRPLFDMVIFFGGAYASTRTATFRESDRPLVIFREDDAAESWHIERRAYLHQRSSRSGSGLLRGTPVGGSQPQQAFHG